MTAFVRARNLPYSVEDIRKMIKGCRICGECKPRFHKPPKVNLIKATQPMGRLNLDFKGPLPSCTSNNYMLTIVDEYSRYPFAIPCEGTSASTVNKASCQLYSLFGVPSYIHSDRGAAFMSKELRGHLHDKGIATSRTTPYNPQGNGLVERYNGTIWKAVTLALKSHNLSNKHWEVVLPDALHSIRTLISTATNCTPHERVFNFQRRTSTGVSLPTWLSSPGPVLLRRFVRKSKYDPLVDEVELFEANPQYANIRHPDGRESTVSLRDLAPCGNNEDISSSTEEPERANIENTSPSSDDNPERETVREPGYTPSTTIPSLANQKESVTVDFKNSIESSVENPPCLRRSKRAHKPPDRLDL